MISKATLKVLSFVGLGLIASLLLYFATSTGEWLSAGIMGAFLSVLVYFLYKWSRPVA